MASPKDASKDAPHTQPETASQPTHPDAAAAPTRRISRRDLLKGSGAATAAVVLGGMASSAALAARPATAPAAPTVSAPRAPLVKVDSHAATARTRPPRGAAFFAAAPGDATIRILPIDRAKFLVGTRFDLRVEATDVDPTTTQISISVRERRSGPAAILVGEPERTSSAADSFEVTYRSLSYAKRGRYIVKVVVQTPTGTTTEEVNHEVVVASTKGRPARNVIFFLGDGMGTAPVTAARILSKGISEGKYHDLLNIDRMEYRGLVGTSGTDSIATDSANSMSAYMTGHKAAVNAMGVYDANELDPAKHPRVETLAEVLKRVAGKSVGVVTTSEIQDATPAAVWAHTRRRSEYVSIMDQALVPEQQPDVILGGGRATLLPQGEAGSRRTDSRDLRQEFRAKGFKYVATRAELRNALRRVPNKLLGTFHNGNMNVYLDREQQGLYPEQPTLVEMTEAALKVLQRKKNGFFLMVEAASIDKMEHPLDGTRTIYDTIEFDQAIGAAVKWAKKRGDTLIVVTADHNHSMSIVGTHDRSVRDGTGMDRSGNGVYADAGFPTYLDADGDGFPDDPDPDVQLFFGWSNHPDHPDDFQADATFTQPALSQGGIAVPNPSHDPGAVVQIGNLPFNQTNCVHTVEDVSVFASGPGAARFNAFQDNTEVFFGMADALGLKIPASRRRGRSTAIIGPGVAVAATPEPVAVG